MVKLKALLALALALAAAGASDAPVAAPTPARALHQLVDGNMRYILGAPAAPRRNAARREEVARGQHPVAAVLACADSRVPAEILFDQGLGDLFTVRTAGNVAGSSEIGSIEYAVEHLHVPLIVVIGHTKCGAVGAAVGKAGGAVSHLPPHIEGLVSHILPAVAAVKESNPALAGDALAAAVVKRNVTQAMRELLESSEIVREAVAAGKVQLVGGVYDLESGKVDFTGPLPDGGPLAKSETGPSTSHASVSRGARPLANTPAQVPAVAHTPAPAAQATASAGGVASAEATASAQPHGTVTPHAAPAAPLPDRQEADARPAPQPPHVAH
jgi:carbonic anhydrase